VSATVLGGQAGCAERHGWRSLTIALRITRSLRMGGGERELLIRSRLLVMTVLVCGLAARSTVRLEWRCERAPS
jgi:hypothetical protein